MEYVSLHSFRHYDECARLVEGMGYSLVELKVTPQKGAVRVQAVVACRDAGVSVGVDDCARVHRALLGRLEELLGTDSISMELSSPGLERNIRNAAEFPLFVGRGIRVWDRESAGWLGGVLVSADERAVVLRLEGSEETRAVPLEHIAKAKFIHL